MSAPATSATWWDELRAAALVGTARRPAPTPPGRLARPEAPPDRETALLDAAALASALRRCAPPRTGDRVAEPAGPDTRPPAPERAVQLVDLLLHQTPAGPRLTSVLLAHWLRTADDRGVRAPHHLLPDLLALATRDASLRSLVLRVGDARGRWLAAANPAWAWAGSDAAPVEVDPAGWARLTTDERELALLRLRDSDPATARELLESTWSSDPAAARATLLATLRRGLGPDDAALLERALDDRSAKVRETALRLLDRLPASPRGERMAARLRGLLGTTGRLRRGLEVELPLEPDAAGVRDGLGAPRAGGSQRDHWLATTIRAAPLEVWTEVSGADPSATWRMLRDARARSLLLETVLLRRDARWAAAVLRDTWEPRLLALLPADEVGPLVTPRAAKAQLHELPALLGHLPGPWDLATSRAVVRRLTGEPDHERSTLAAASLAELLARGLHPDVRGELRAWAERLAPEQRRRVSPVLSYLTLVPDITEALS